MPHFIYEEELIERGLWPVCGVDEAGRGPLVGACVTSAVILDPRRIPAGIDDSKALSESRRETLYDAIMESALAVSVASASASEIDDLNILVATMTAMRRAVVGLAIQPAFALIDGNKVPNGLPCPARAVVKGDAQSLSIAAASIIAKTVRDRQMKRLGAIYPGYGFEKHSGYGTAAHLKALSELGPTPHHRMSFAPLKQPTPKTAVQQFSLFD